jgi:hypothetical protein
MRVLAHSLIALAAVAAAIGVVGLSEGTGSPPVTEGGQLGLTGGAGDRAAANPPDAVGPRRAGERARRHAPIRWRDSVAIGAPEAGRLVRGVRFPREGASFVTWDPIKKRSPSRGWRRWGTDVLVRTTLRVLHEFRRAHPNAPRIAIGDLSRPEGGDFGPQYGSIGHATHQNGLDVDVYYPRRDRRERPPDSPSEVNLRLAQDLVDRFVDAGAVRVFVGPNTPLDGPKGIVEAIPHHDNHLHARLAG